MTDPGAVQGGFLHLSRKCLQTYSARDILRNNFPLHLGIFSHFNFEHNIILRDFLKKTPTTHFKLNQILIELQVSI